MQASRNIDTLILGAGPGGAATALFLAKKGIPCTLVDKAVFPRDKICGDALSGKVVEVLRKLDPGIVERLSVLPTQVGSWGVTFVAPNEKPLRVPFRKDFNKDAEVAPGFIAKRLDFDNFLIEECRRHPSIEIIEGLELKHFERIEGGIQCQSADKTQCFTARMVIAADGAQSRFARQMHNYKVRPKQHCGGIRAYYSGVTGMDNDNFIELHFLKDFLPGYFWIFPLPNGGANVGVGMRSDVISKQKVNLKKEMLRIIEELPQLKERFANAKLEEPIRGFGLPLGSKKWNLTGDHYMLAGDAGSLIDPFTGEGIGNALYCGFFAAEQIARSQEADRYDHSFLKQYDKEVYERLWSELKLSRRMQQLVRFPWLFNLVVNKANKNKVLSETISCMFEDLDLRDRLRKPSFYFKLIMNR